MLWGWTRQVKVQIKIDKFARILGINTLLQKLIRTVFGARLNCPSKMLYFRNKWDHSYSRIIIVQTRLIARMWCKCSAKLSSSAYQHHMLRCYCFTAVSHVSYSFVVLNNVTFTVDIILYSFKINWLWCCNVELPYWFGSAFKLFDELFLKKLENCGFKMFK